MPIAELPGLSPLEVRVGRRLTAAEQHIDVEAIDQRLNDTVDELDQLITAEQHRFAHQIATGSHARMTVTTEMLMSVGRLVSYGRTEAARELRSMRLLPRHHATDDPPPL